MAVQKFEKRLPGNLDLFPPAIDQAIQRLLVGFGVGSHILLCFEQKHFQIAYIAKLPGEAMKQLDIRFEIAFIVEWAEQPKRASQAAAGNTHFVNIFGSATFPDANLALRQFIKVEGEYFAPGFRHRLIGAYTSAGNRLSILGVSGASGIFPGVPGLGGHGLFLTALRT